MFEQVFENLQKATETSVKMQQDVFQKWLEAFPGSPSVTTTTGSISQWQKNWEELTASMLQQQKEMVDRNYEAGIKALDDIFAVSESKSPQEFQQKITELYRKSFESLQHLSEAQLNEFKSAAEKWMDLVTTSSR